MKLRIIPCLLAFIVAGQSLESAELSGEATFFKRYCWSCHDASTETALNLEYLSGDLNEVGRFEAWVKVFDKLKAREMPPLEAEQPNAALVTKMTNGIGKNLLAANLKRYEASGRTPARRLTKTEYRYTIQDLMYIVRDVTTHLPAETETGGFDTIGGNQRLSAVHMEGFMKSADLALDEAFSLGESPYQDFTIDICDSPRLAYHDGKTFIDGGGIYRRIDAGVVLFHDAEFLLPSHAHHFEVKRAGKYRITIDAESYQSDVPLLLKVICKDSNGGARMIGKVDVTSDEPVPFSVVVELQPGDSFYPSYENEDNEQGGGIDFLIKNGDMNYQGKGIHIKSINIRGPLEDQWPSNSAKQVLTGIELEHHLSDRGKSEFIPHPSAELLTHVQTILREFIFRAFRRPVEEAELQSYLSLALPGIKKGEAIEQILRVPLRAILSSPQFMLFEETPGKLNSYSLANRLSYFLWRSMPDAELFAAAASGQLNHNDSLLAQVDRMLADDKSKRFVNDFLGQWLMLHKLNATSPDQRVYWEFDEVLSASLLEETEMFYKYLIDENLSATNLIDSDFVFVNRRLARHYDLPPVQGQHLRKVTLPVDSPRGGVLTQASVLKTTANGSNTSPVVRGNYVLTNLYGTPPASPPPTIGSVEPDIRGKSTIREILAAHRNVASCNHCHKSIDPPGFALESFDPIGTYRDRYRVRIGDVIDQTLQVDPSGTTATGKKFTGINEFKKLMLEEKDLIIGNYIEKLVEFSTGSEIQFADREEVHGILTRVSENGYRLRDIIHEVVLSDLFQQK